TLWAIAQQYGINVNAIIQANQLSNPDQIETGEILFIPPIIHIIQPGETIAQIANQYGTTVQAIVNENNIQNPDIISPGTQLVIPRRKPVIETNAYTYQPPEEAVESINKVGNLLTYLSPFAYQ